MKRQILTALLIGQLVTGMGAASAQAQEVQAPVSRFSHKGLKASAGFGGLNADADIRLKDGEAFSLNLGYGFSDRVTLWLTLLGAEHPGIAGEQVMTDFGGVEVNFQYKFATRSALQPYGKVGLGGYGLSEEGSNKLIFGGGLNLALGVDYFFSRHFGIGAELMFKGIQYSRESIRVNGNDVVSDLDRKLDGDSVGLLLTFTIQ